VDAQEPKLSVAAVARRLGVAPATLRTWDRRYGVGPSDHASGRHRRYGAIDIARLELMQQALLRGASPAEAARYALAAGHIVPAFSARGPVPSARGDGSEPLSRDGGEPPLLSGGQSEPDLTGRVRVGGRVLRLPGVSRRARGLGRAVLTMDSAAVLRLLTDCLAEDGVIATWDECLRPVLGAVARRWEHSGEGVEVEHLLSECVVAALTSVVASAPTPVNPRPVLLACVPDELHSLPLHALAAALAVRKVSSRLLGAAVPVDALAAAVRRIAPAAVLLWAQLPRYADPHLLTGLPRTRQHVRLFAGGPGWHADALPRQAEVLTSLHEAAEQITQAARG
jgi:hypothetical protein